MLVTRSRQTRDKTSLLALPANSLYLAGTGDKIAFLPQIDKDKNLGRMFSITGSRSEYVSDLQTYSVLRNVNEKSIFFAEIGRAYTKEGDGHSIEVLDNYRTTVSNFYSLNYQPNLTLDPNFYNDLSMVKTPLKPTQFQAIAHVRNMMCETFLQEGETFYKGCWKAPHNEGKVVAQMNVSEQGQGKSFMAAATAHSVGAMRVLIVTLSSTTGKIMPNGKARKGWAEEVQRHLGITPVIFSGRGKSADTRKAYYTALGNMPFIWAITSYETLRNDIDTYIALDAFDVIIFDESVKLMTPGAALSKAVIKYMESKNAPAIRIALCGTPVTKSAADLYSQLLSLGVFRKEQYDVKKWRKLFAYKQQIFVGGRTVTRWVGINNAEELSSIAAHCWFRIGKDYATMPPKFHRTEKIAMTPEEYKEYSEIRNGGDLFDSVTVEKIRNAEAPIDEETGGTVDAAYDGSFAADIASASMRTDAEDASDIRKMIGTAQKNALIRLQRFCGGYAFFKDQDGNQTLRFCMQSKAKWLYEYLQKESQAVAPCGTRNKKFIIWCYYNAEVDMIVDMCNYMGVKAAKVTGAVDTDTLSDIQEEFQTGDVQVIVAQIRRMYAGANLQAADTHVYYSQPWSPMLRAQSEDRSHRIGRDFYVEYITLEMVDPNGGQVIDGHINVNILEKKMAVLRAISVDTVAHAIDNMQAVDLQMQIMQELADKLGFKIEAGTFTPLSKFDDVVLDAGAEEGDTVLTEDIVGYEREDENGTTDDE